MTIEFKWLKGEREAAAYARMCLSTWKRFKRSYPVRHVKLPSGSTRYRPEWIDACLMQFAENPAGGINQIVEDVMKEF
jgi:hypothetical protein